MCAVRTRLAGAPWPTMNCASSSWQAMITSNHGAASTASVARLVADSVMSAWLNECTSAAKVTNGNCRRSCGSSRLPMGLSLDTT